jgi:hypothetical protein
VDTIVDNKSKNKAIQKSDYHINWWTMAVLTTVAVASLKSDPASAFYGLGSIFYFMEVILWTRV